MMPAAAGKIVIKSTKHYGSWKNAISATPYFRKANWVSIAAYPQWKAEIATPAFRSYLADKISLDELGKQLSDGWTKIRG